MSPLESFAATYRLRVVRDVYNRHICQGRGQSLIAEFGGGRLSVLLMGTSSRWWTGRRAALVAAGGRVEQNGDTEGSVSFEASNEAACAVAIRAAGVKRRRVAPPPTEAQLAARARFATMNRGTTRNGTSRPQIEKEAGQ